MKKYILFWIIISISISISCKSSPLLTPTIIGKWTATVHNEEISYYFTKHNMVIFTMKTPGFPFQPIRGKYSINYSAKPIQLKIFDFDYQNMKDDRLLGIVEFQNNNEMLFEYKIDSKRQDIFPSNFKDTSLKLKRMAGGLKELNEYVPSSNDILITSLQPGNVVTLSGIIVHVYKEKIYFEADENHQRIKFYKPGSVKPDTVRGFHITNVPDDVLKRLRKISSQVLNKKSFIIKAEYWKDGRRSGFKFKSIKDITK